MNKVQTWHEASLHHSAKKAHQKSIISVSPLDSNLFYTSSEDATLRLWDLRLHSSVKLFKHASLNTLSNCDNDRQHVLYVGCNSHVYSFDSRKQGVFVEQIHSQSKQAHLDDIEFIRYNEQKQLVAAADYEGNIHLYNTQLDCVEKLSKGHHNIVNALEFISSQQSNLCVTGGFDAKLLHWNIDTHEIVKEVDLQQLFKKSEIASNGIPFIYHIYLHRTTLFVSTQTGHVLAFQIKQPKKPKYILEASLSRVVQTKVPQFNQNLMMTLSRDGSFSLFDHTKRQNKAPLFLQKYKCIDEPNWIEVINSQILVSSATSAQLHFYAVK